ncbi:amino acid racemase [Aliikangiella marina]|uniref:Amino acid racemase n=1 Tax=Aliikangiella marina TaxID=1712262 RepID=A0A545TJI7_9GAMM|nr:amino acid racemase [Aliikangiella marina]TQV77367.1 amino acid racemase [Aliikangiella marina]
MFLNQHKVIGILGGMGPRATIDLYESILSQTKIEKEQDHISTLIFSNPKIPDRSQTLFRSNVKLITYLQQTAIALESAGADVIVIPCNGSHMYLNEIQNAIQVPVINMVEKTIDYATNSVNYQDGVLLLGTAATYQAGLYEKYALNNNLKLILPTELQKVKLMEAIYNIKIDSKITSAKQTILEIINYWKLPSIFGCTEIPLVLNNNDLDFDVINPTQILAEAAINFIVERKAIECLI